MLNLMGILHNTTVRLQCYRLTGGWELQDEVILEGVNRKWVFRRLGGRIPP
jgi:hypothetical protein